MNTVHYTPRLLFTLLAALALQPAHRIPAQALTNLHSFAGGDGAYPASGVILSGPTLYGTASTDGGYTGYGTVFKVNTDSTGFAVLHTFSGESDGGIPYGGLTLSGNTLFGTLTGYATSNKVTVFAVNTDGSGFRVVHRAAGSDGIGPHAGVILLGNTLYGTTRWGGDTGKGTVFKVQTDGSGYATLHSFALGAYGSGLYLNSDGTEPQAKLFLSGNTLYGTAAFGGIHGYGTLFKIDTDGTGFGLLHHFTGDSDGRFPATGVSAAVANRLYGTAQGAYAVNKGTVFAVNTDGSDFRTLHEFTGGSDGSRPSADLIPSGGFLYGSAMSGGTSGAGTIFKMRTDGSGFATIYNFTALTEYFVDPDVFSSNEDGAAPVGLMLSGNTLYGMAQNGGSVDKGTVFSLSLPAGSFAEWVARFGLNGPEAGAGADPDADGLPGGVEYVLGGNPAEAAPCAPPAITITEAGITVFTFTRDDISETFDVTLTVEAGTDLLTWPTIFNIGPDNAGSSPGVSIVENGSAPDTITVTIPQDTAKAKFARLNVTVFP